MDDWKFQPARDQGLSPADRLKSLKRESGLIDTLLHHLWWGFVRCYLKIYHRFSLRGRENLPTEAPFIIVANHASHLDVLALAGSCPARLRDRPRDRLRVPAGRHGPRQSAGAPVPSQRQPRLRKI